MNGKICYRCFYSVNSDIGANNAVGGDSAKVIQFEILFLRMGQLYDNNR